MGTPTQVLIHEHGVDVNRGATIRKSICMHKDEPGIYFTKSGYEVTDKAAKSVGFQVDEHRKTRAINLEIAQAKREIEIKFGRDKAAIEQQFVDPSEGKMTDSELVLTRNLKGYPMETKFYLMKHKGMGKWIVQDKQDDHKARIEPTSREEAIDWMLRHAEAEERVSE